FQITGYFNRYYPLVVRFFLSRSPVLAFGNMPALLKQAVVVILKLKELLSEYYYYALKCANALFASAILCVSSFFLMAAPSLRDAAIISFASLSAIDFSFRPRAYPISHLMLSAVLRSGRISVGI